MYRKESSCRTYASSWDILSWLFLFLGGKCLDDLMYKTFSSK